MKSFCTRIFQFIPRVKNRKSVMRRTRIVTRLSGESGLPEPRSVPKCVGILLWEAIPAARVTLARRILAGQEEQGLVRARRQNPGSSQSTFVVVMAPAGVGTEVYPGGCTQGGVQGRIPGPGSTREA